MKRFLASLALVASLAAFPLYLTSCATAQKTEFQTVSAAAAAVETARAAYYDIDHQCLANPSTTTLCPKIIAAHDSLLAAYVKYQAGVKTLADANIALLTNASDTTLKQKVADAGAALIQLATDFITLESSVGGK